MKRMIGMALAALLVLCSMAASAQSLGDVARSARKGKSHQSAANHKYDNDNLPKEDHLSVVGPTPAVAVSTDNPAAGAQLQQVSAPAVDAKAAAQDRQQAADEWKQKIDDQRKKVETLTRDLELTQREYRLRAVAMYSDAGNRLRNSSNWDKEDKEFKQQIDEKQKAVDEAKQDLDQMKENARKAGAPSSSRE